MIRWIDQVAGSTAVCLATFSVGGGMLLVLKLSRNWWRSRYREPFQEGILRPPGWGCLERRQDALFDFASIVGALPVFWAGLAYVIITGTVDVIVGCLLVAVPLTVVSIWWLQKAFTRARTEKLGFLGECAVAEALAPITGRGWFVFHDVPMTGAKSAFNIDHVAVGPGGVWAVETKAFSKAKLGRSGEGNLKVEGEVVRLPNGQRKRPFRQAKGQAVTLRDRLNEEGSKVSFVEPLVMLPGWSVNYGKDSSRSIRDPRNVVPFLEAQPVRMSSAQINEVAGICEKWCRVLRFDPKEEK